MAVWEFMLDTAFIAFVDIPRSIFCPGKYLCGFNSPTNLNRYFTAFHTFPSHTTKYLQKKGDLHVWNINKAHRPEILVLPHTWLTIAHSSPTWDRQHGAQNIVYVKRTESLHHNQQLWGEPTSIHIWGIGYSASLAAALFRPWSLAFMLFNHIKLLSSSSVVSAISVNELSVRRPAIGHLRPFQGANHVEDMRPFR